MLIWSCGLVILTSLVENVKFKMADGAEEMNLSFHELNLDGEYLHFETHELEESLQMNEIRLGLK